MVFCFFAIQKLDHLTDNKQISTIQIPDSSGTQIPAVHNTENNILVHNIENNTRIITRI